MKIQELYEMADELKEETSEKKYIFIDKFDKDDNLAVFFFKTDRNKEYCGGHICLYNRELHKLSVDFGELMQFFAYCQFNGIEVRFDNHFSQ